MHHFENIVTSFFHLFESRCIFMPNFWGFGDILSHPVSWIRGNVSWTFCEEQGSYIVYDVVSTALHSFPPTWFLGLFWDFFTRLWHLDDDWWLALDVDGFDVDFQQIAACFLSFLQFSEIWWSCSLNVARSTLEDLVWSVWHAFVCAKLVYCD